MDMPKSPIGGSFAWTVPEVMQRDDWICRLAPSDVAEIEAAVGHAPARARHPGDRARRLPARPADDAARRLRAQIRSGLGFGYIKGLPVERYDRETLIRIYWGLSRHIGDPITQNRNGHVVSHVIDVGDTAQDHNRRLTQSTAELCFHTDSCDVVGLLCINRAKERRREHDRERHGRARRADAAAARPAGRAL